MTIFVVPERYRGVISCSIEMLCAIVFLAMPQPFGVRCGSLILRSVASLDRFEALVDQCQLIQMIGR